MYWIALPKIKTDLYFIFYYRFWFGITKWHWNDYMTWLIKNESRGSITERGKIISTAQTTQHLSLIFEVVWVITLLSEIGLFPVGPVSTLSGNLTFFTISNAILMIALEVIVEHNTNLLTEAIDPKFRIFV